MRRMICMISIFATSGQSLFVNCGAMASGCKGRGFFQRWAPVEKLAGCIAEAEAACKTDNEQKVCARCLKEAGKSRSRKRRVRGRRRRLCGADAVWIPQCTDTLTGFTFGSALCKGF